MKEFILLKIHLSVCSFCRLFKKQSLMVSDHAGDIHLHHEYQLSEEKKEEIISLLQ